MKKNATVLLLSLSFTTSVFAGNLIKSFKIEEGFNDSISQHLPGAIHCADKLLGTPEFNKRVEDAYGGDAQGILAKIKKARLDLTFLPFVAPKKTIASTNMLGRIKLNNIHNRKTLESLTNTVSHESIHNVGFKHDDSYNPDVAYTLGNIVEEMVEDGFCNEDSRQTRPIPQVKPQTPPPVQSKKPSLKKRLIRKIRLMF